METQRSSQRARQREELLQIIEALQPGDRLIVSELSRLGRSLSQILQIIDRLRQKEVRLGAIKEAIRFEGRHNIQTKAMIALFGLFAEVERDLIAERTKEGLAAAKARGQRLGHPQGGLSKSKLDGVTSGPSYRNTSPRPRSPGSWMSLKRPSIISSGPGSFSPQKTGGG
jgi:DNA invertase Pin-like site-specific DNA recombinase